MNGSGEFIQRLGRHRYLVSVIVPCVVLLLYLGSIAADGYVARAQVMVENDGGTALPALELGLLSLGSESNKKDALVVQTYMQSDAMLRQIDQKLDLRGHFSGATVDVVQRLDDSVSRNDFLDYYRRRLDTHVDQESYVIDVAFTAFDPDYAVAVVETVLQYSENFVNNASQQLAREQLRFIQGEVDAAYTRVKEASQRLVELQRKTEVFSPEAESIAAGEIIGGLLQELSRQRTELRALEGFLHEETAEVRMARQRVQALQAQISEERGRLVGVDQGGLNDLWLRYQDAEVTLNLATEVYKNALASLEKTRLDAARKVKYLVAVSSPGVPDEAERPRVLYWFVTVFILLNLLYFVVDLVIATIKDHQE